MSRDLSSFPRRLGAAGPQVFPMALGCMGMSGMYGAAGEQESLATIDAALEAGVTCFDTGDFYGMGHNEMLLGRALKGRRERAIVSVKFGAMRTPSGAWIGVDTRPASVKNFLAYSLKRLGMDYVDIYRPSRFLPNGEVAIEDTMGAIAEMIQAGYVRWAGLSEVGAETIRRAHAVTPVADLQIEYSLISRGPEKTTFPAVRELGIGVTAYGVLSRGLLSGSNTAGAGDFRAHLPRFTGENREQNQKIVDALTEFGRVRGYSATQIAIAWAMAKGDYIVPVLGARTRTQLREALAGAAVELSAGEIGELEALVPADAAAGTRYDARQMGFLDSERG